MRWHSRRGEIQQLIPEHETARDARFAELGAEIDSTFSRLDQRLALISEGMAELEELAARIAREV